MASPETAERIAVLAAATTGRLWALGAARLNLRRSGWEATRLEGLDGARLPDTRLADPVHASARAPRLNVATATQTPPSTGRTWTEEEYAARDGALVALGLPADLLHRRGERVPTLPDATESEAPP
ncbi:MAG TPA: hypothetical protein VGP82_10385 [Ktedonobacterales bacterium]|jgi:hypothetical protein|nr:hypothetical protein [Ktedonobacterales bacterium]